MKKIQFAAIITICMTSFLSFAQKPHSSFGINAGVTFASYKVKDESVSITAKSKIGFTAGVTASMPLGQNFSFRPSLNYTQKGGKYSESGFTDKTTFNYLELPLNFVYNTSSDNGKFFIGAGPSLSLGLSGKDKYEEAGVSEESDIKFGNGDDDDLKALDAGINFLAGYEFAGGFFIAANYYAGLSNLAISTAGDNGKMHNRYFGARVGVMFGGNKKTETKQE